MPNLKFSNETVSVYDIIFQELDFLIGNVLINVNELKFLKAALYNYCSEINYPVTKFDFEIPLPEGRFGRFFYSEGSSRVDLSILIDNFTKRNHENFRLDNFWKKIKKRQALSDN